MAINNIMKILSAVNIVSLSVLVAIALDNINIVIKWPIWVITLLLACNLIYPLFKD